MPLELGSWFSLSLNVSSNLLILSSFMFNPSIVDDLTLIVRVNDFFQMFLNVNLGIPI